MEFKLGPHHSLTEKSTDWNFDSDGDSQEIERQMIDFMLVNRGIGLAANQIAVTKRVFVIGSRHIQGFPEPFALFNPRIIESSKDLILDQEGCLSYPDLYLTVKRPSWIVAEYRNSQGHSIEARFDGYLSKCFQHELDHLNGICFVDRVSQLKLQLAMKKLRKNK
jgi:peptide deformylase